MLYGCLRLGVVEVVGAHKPEHLLLVVAVAVDRVLACFSLCQRRLYLTRCIFHSALVERVERVVWLVTALLAELAGHRAFTRQTAAFCF